MVVGDIVDKNTCKEIVDSTIEKFNFLHVLVNNAGGNINSSFMEITEELLDDMLNLNFKSVFILTQLAVPHLVKTKGKYTSYIY